MGYDLCVFLVPLQDIDHGDTNEDIWDGEGAYGGFLAAAATMTVSSSSIDDDGDPAGSGALTVRVVGLDTNWAEVTQDVTMDGQTEVTLGTDLIRVYRAYVLTAGSGATNAGDIWVGTGTVTAGIPAVKHAGILTGNGETLMAIYSIPATQADGDTIRQAKILRWYAGVGAAASAYASVALQTREFGGAWRTRQVANISEGSGVDQSLSWGIELGPKADIRIRALTNGVANSSISAGFDIALIV